MITTRAKKQLLLSNLYPGDKFKFNGKTYQVNQHEHNMTEVWSYAENRFFVWWIFSKIHEKV